MAAPQNAESQKKAKHSQVQANDKSGAAVSESESLSDGDSSGSSDSIEYEDSSSSSGNSEIEESKNVMELAELQKKERDILDAPDKDLSISIESCFNSDQKLEETKLPSVSK